MSEIKHKCYNSFSCILSVLIIVFVVGSVMWDICITKPAMREDIQEIRTEIKDIHRKISVSFVQDSVIPPTFEIVPEDTLVLMR